MNESASSGGMSHFDQFVAVGINWNVFEGNRRNDDALRLRREGLLAEKLKYESSIHRILKYKDARNTIKTSNSSRHRKGELMAPHKEIKKQLVPNDFSPPESCFTSA